MKLSKTSKIIFGEQYIWGKGMQSLCSINTFSLKPHRQNLHSEMPFAI